MSDVDLIATKSFSYATRRLRPDDRFTVPANMARVLIGIGKAQPLREPGRVSRPPAAIASKIAAEAPAPVDAPDPVEPVPVEAPRPVPAISTVTVAPTKRRARKSAAKKG